MGKTKVSVKGNNFYINDKLTYSEIVGSTKSHHGLLTNARFIQGVFDDALGTEKYDRFDKRFDADNNTEELIKALPEWYDHGLRAITVGFQGGGPCFTIDNAIINNNPFGCTGLELNEDYKRRMDKIISSADEIGIVVIVSFFYPGQIDNLDDGRAIVNAVKTAARFLKDNDYTNVIIEICNEFDLVKNHPIASTDEGMAMLIKLAREESGGMLVSSSLSGGKVYKEVAQESDIVLIHGNRCSRQTLYNLINLVREYSGNKPIVINEDSQSIGQSKVAFNEHVSWGYYNNLTKQEPPTYWGITKGEDEFFAKRIAMEHGIKTKGIPNEQQYYLQGLESYMMYEGKRWIKLASLYPETIDYVEFYKNDKLYYTCYDEPYSVNWLSNWRQGSIDYDKNDKWTAKVFLRSEKIIYR